jgi:hypothetical protein
MPIDDVSTATLIRPPTERKEQSAIEDVLELTELAAIGPVRAALMLLCP